MDRSKRSPFIAITVIYYLAIVAAASFNPRLALLICPLYSVVMYIFLYLKTPNFSQMLRKSKLINCGMLSWILITYVTAYPTIIQHPVSRENWIFMALYLISNIIFSIELMRRYLTQLSEFGNLRYLSATGLYCILMMIIFYPAIRFLAVYYYPNLFEFFLLILGFFIIVFNGSQVLCYFFQIMPLYKNEKALNLLHFSLFAYFSASFCCLCRIAFLDIVVWFELAFYSVFPVLFFHLFLSDDMLDMKPVYRGIDLAEHVLYLEYLPSIISVFTVLGMYKIDVITWEAVYVLMLVVFLYMNMEIYFQHALIKKHISDYEYMANVDLERNVQIQTTNLLKIMEELSNRINTDDLTGLYSRDYYMELAHSLIYVDGFEFALILINVDGFKNFNNMYGNEAGDSLLVEIANRLKSEFGEENYVYRFDADIFGLHFFTISYSALEKLHSRAMEILKAPFLCAGRALNLTFSSGCARYPNDAVSPEQLLQFANISLQEAKKVRHNRKLFFYSADYGKELEKRNLLERYINYLDIENELHIVYQMQHDLYSLKPVAISAELAWKNKPYQDGLELFKYAGQTGLIDKILVWFINKLVSDISGIVALGVEINLISVKLMRDVMDLQEALPLSVQAFTANKLPLSMLEFEIHNDELFNYYYDNRPIFRTLATHNIGISLSDFGIGYSSLFHLKKSGVAKVVISKDLVQSIDTDEMDLMVVKSIVTLANGLGLIVLAEGVSRITQHEILKQFGCDFISGDFCSEPLPGEEFWRIYMIENGGSHVLG